MSDQLEVLIHWEIGVLEDKLDEYRKNLNTLMIDRNTAALRVIALNNAGLPYPSDVEGLESLDQRVATLVEQIKFTRRQIVAWGNLLENLTDPSVQQQVQPMIRTVELKLP
jgi:recombinational DNA repair ATPase RecF